MRYRRWEPPSPASGIGHSDQLRARTSSTDTCLPQSLLSLLSDCAVNCIHNFATTFYPGATCADTSSLIYLCTQENTSGLTIGEGSLQCVVSFCTGQNRLDSVYSVCDGVAGAQPETARTITATIAAPSATTASTMDNLPPTIGVPTSTEQVTTIVMATNTPPLATATATPSGASTGTGSSSISLGGHSPSSASSSMSSSPQSTAITTSTGDRASSKPSLSTAQIAGIAVGGAATAIVVFGLLMIAFCMRKRRRERRRSQRRSRLVEHMPPSEYRSPQKKASPNFGQTGSIVAVPNNSGRFYAPQQPVEEKRRSFWRRSIRPEEIGIAVSPKMPYHASRMSASSQQTISQLLPADPSQGLWPAPLDVEATRERRRYTRRPTSEATLFDDDLEAKSAELEPIVIDNQAFVLEKAPSRRQRVIPPRLRLPVVPEDKSKAVLLSAPMPLTPTYDNGNINVVSPPRNLGSPPSTAAGTTETTQNQSQSSIPIIEHDLAPSSTYAARNVLRKKPPSRLPLRAINSQISEPWKQPVSITVPPVARTAPVMERQNSVTSVYTEIEEDTTPDEIEKQLGLRANPPTPSIIPARGESPYSGQESPIKDLRYPAIPRSAAVSRQAEIPPRPRARFPIEQPPQPRPTRSQLVRAEARFMPTDTTSSDGYLSDETIEWPAPPSSETSSRKPKPLTTSALKQSMEKVRTNAAGGGGGSLTPLFNPSLDEVLSSDSRRMRLAVPQRSPSTKARLTPSKSRNGDLYLTVEI